MSQNPLLLLLVGFLLSGVAGGLLTFVFQQRAWRHQHDVQRRELLREQAQQTFEDLSTLLDKRLYRMRLVLSAARRHGQAPVPAGGAGTGRLDASLVAYRQVLELWNDNLNRNIALVDSYFGRATREIFEGGLLADFAAIGEELDQFVREVSAAQPGAPARRIAPRLNRLGEDVYAFNVRLLRALRDDELGDAAPGTGAGAPPARTWPRFGERGEHVRALQRALRASGAPDLIADGAFGMETERALGAVQERLGVAERFVAGAVTLRALGLLEGDDGDDGDRPPGG